jgi:hypothetical protein
MLLLATHVTVPASPRCCPIRRASIRLPTITSIARNRSCRLPRPRRQSTATAANLKHLDEIDQALSTEIADCESRLRMLEIDRQEALTAVVVAEGSRRCLTSFPLPGRGCARCALRFSASAKSRCFPPAAGKSPKRGAARPRLSATQPVRSGAGQGRLAVGQ